MKNIYAIAGMLCMTAVGFAAGWCCGTKKARKEADDEMDRMTDFLRGKREISEEAKEKAARQVEETRFMSEEEMHEYLVKEFGMNDDPAEEDEEEDDGLDDNGLEVLTYAEAIEKYHINERIAFDGVAKHMTVEEREASIPEIIYGNEAGEENETGEAYDVIVMEWHSDGVLTEDPYQMVEWDPIETIGNEACDILETSPGATIYVRNHRLRKDIMIEQTGETYEEMFASRPWLNKKED